jgi:hypothetical protein
MKALEDIKFNRVLFFLLIVGICFKTAYCGTEYERHLLFEFKDEKKALPYYPYSVKADLQGNLWVSDSIKGKCYIVKKNHKIVIFADGALYKKLNKEQNFRINWVSDQMVLLESCVLSRKSKKEIINFAKFGFLTPTYVSSAGFTKDNRVFINTLDTVLVIDKSGRVHHIGPGRQMRGVNRVICYYYDCFSKTDYIVKIYNDATYIVNNRLRIRKQVNGACNIAFVDKNGLIYLTEDYFKYECPAEESLICIVDRNLKLKGQIVLHRNFKKNIVEEIVGFSSNGEIFVSESEYSTKKCLRIYKIVPVVKGKKR